jgi:hypothetical protein
MPIAWLRSGRVIVIHEPLRCVGQLAQCSKVMPHQHQQTGAFFGNGLMGCGSLCRYGQLFFEQSRQKRATKRKQCEGLRPAASTGE